MSSWLARCTKSIVVSLTLVFLLSPRILADDVIVTTPTSMLFVNGTSGEQWVISELVLGVGLALVVEPDGNVLVKTNGQLIRIDTDSGAQSTVLDELQYSLIAMDSSGRLIAGGADGIASIDLNDGTITPLVNDLIPIALATSNDGEIIAVSGESVVAFETATQEKTVIASSPEFSSATDIALSLDGQILITTRAIPYIRSGSLFIVSRTNGSVSTVAYLSGNAPQLAVISETRVLVTQNDGVRNPAQEGIKEYNLETGAAALLTVIGTVGQHPTDIVLDPAGDLLILGDLLGGCSPGPVHNCTPTAVGSYFGHLELGTMLGTNLSYSGMFIGAADLVFGASGRLFTARNNTAYEVDPNTGRSDFLATLAQSSPVSSSVDVVEGGAPVFANSGLLQIDLVTGSDSLLATGGLTIGYWSSVTAHPDGSLLASFLSLSADTQTGIYRIEPELDTSDLIVDISAEDLQLEGPNSLLAITDSELIRIDLESGDLSTVTSGGMLVNPAHIAIEQDGAILLTDSSADLVLRIDPLTGAQTIVSSGGKMVGPLGIAIIPEYEFDADSDGVIEFLDNCIAVYNPDQPDTNGDGYGNACDGDLNNDDAINFADLGLMKSVFFTDDPDADLNGDGAVNFADLGLLKAMFYTAPGPSALTP